jgi:hypothetical protein
LQERLQGRVAARVVLSLRDVLYRAPLILARVSQQEAMAYVLHNNNGRLFWADVATKTRQHNNRDYFLLHFKVKQKDDNDIPPKESISSTVSPGRTLSTARSSSGHTFSRLERIAPTSMFGPGAAQATRFGHEKTKTTIV